MKILTIMMLLFFCSCGENKITQDLKDNLSLETSPNTVQVISVSSSLKNGTYNKGDTIKVQVSFNEVVTVQGTPSIELAFDSGSKKAFYSSGSGSSILTFAYTIQEVDRATDLAYSSSSALDLEGGQITHAGTQAASLQLPSPGTPTSLSGAKDFKVGLSDDFNKGTISSQWTLLDKDNYDMNGDGNPSNDESMSFFQDKGALSLNGRGRDVWRTTHEFLGLYLENQRGDFDYSVKIFQRNNVNFWGKSGLMISSNMSDLNTGGTLQCVTTPNRKIALQHEGRLGDISQNRVDSSSTSTLPVWIRLKKRGNQVTCYFKYSEGAAWTEHDKGAVTLNNLTSTFDVGLISTAHNRSSSSIVQFDDFKDLGQ